MNQQALMQKSDFPKGGGGTGPEREGGEGDREIWDLGGASDRTWIGDCQGRRRKKEGRKERKQNIDKGLGR